MMTIMRMRSAILTIAYYIAASKRMAFSRRTSPCRPRVCLWCSENLPATITLRGDLKGGDKFSIIPPLSGSLKSASGLLRRLGASVKGLLWVGQEIAFWNLWSLVRAVRCFFYMACGRGIFTGGDWSPVRGFRVPEPAVFRECREPEARSPGKGDRGANKLSMPLKGILYK